MLISSSEGISTVKPCELEEVLVSLSVNNTSTCKFNAIKNKSTCIRNWGISLLVLISITFVLILNYIWIPNYNKFCIGVRVSSQWILMKYIFCVQYQETQTLCIGRFKYSFHRLQELLLLEFLLSCMQAYWYISTKKCLTTKKYKRIRLVKFLNCIKQKCFILVAYECV